MARKIKIKRRDGAISTTSLLCVNTMYNVSKNDISVPVVQDHSY